MNTEIQQLLEHIQRDEPLSPEDREQLATIVVVRQIEKKQFLIQPGEPSNYMNFIASGVMRTYYMDENAQEHTLQIGIEGWWINDLYGFLTGKPSRMYVQALEDTTVVRIPKKELEELYYTVPALGHFFRRKIQNAYVALQERTIDGMSQQAIDRYRSFLKHYRDIEQRIPQYIVASYLGMTPEFLSHLRKKHAGELS